MKRIQRQRAKGWRMPKNAVYVGRPTPWGNPFEVGASYVYVNGIPMPTLFQPERRPVDDATHAVALYREWLDTRPRRVAAIASLLAGYDLACWCPLDQPCHADVLLEVANAVPA